MQTATKPQHLDMLNGPIWNKLPRYALPVAATGILGQLFNAADIAVVGNFTGDMRTAAVAAVGANSPVIGLLLNLFIGIALGANVVIANAIGRGDRETVHRAVHTSIVTALIGGVIVAIFGQFIAAGLMGLLNVPDDVYPLALAYLRIYLLGMPVILLYNFEAAIFRSVGDTKVPLIALTVSGVLNVILNLFFVIVCKLDVAGVALASTIAQCVSAGLILHALTKVSDCYALDFRKVRLDLNMTKRILMLGVPAGLQNAIFAIANLFIQAGVNSFDSLMVKGNSAAANADAMIYDAMAAFYMACASFMSQNYGAGKWKRMDKVLRNCILLSVVVSLILGGGSYLFGPELLKIYTSDPKVIQCGMEILLYTTVTYFMCGLMDLFPGALRGMGYSAIPMLLSIIGTVGTRIVWIFMIFPRHRSLDVLFISYPASWLITIILQVICYFFVRKRIHNPLP